jgi:hypothetical protein
MVRPHSYHGKRKLTSPHAVPQAGMKVVEKGYDPGAVVEDLWVLCTPVSSSV